MQTLRNRSSIVAPFDVVAVPSYLDAVDLVYRLTARLAATNRSAAALARIQQLQREHAEVTSRGEAAAMIRLNYSFHEAVAQASGNPFYLLWTREVLDQGQRLLGLFLHDVGDQISTHKVSEHGPMVQAIEQRDPDAAEAAARGDAVIIAEQLKRRFTERPAATFDLSVHRLR